MSTVHAKKLHKAIAALPGAPGKKGNLDRFAMFVQTALMALWKSHEAHMASKGVSVGTIAPKVLGFISKKPDEWSALALPLAEAFKAYFAAVVASEPFHDVLGDVFQEMYLADKSMGQFLTPADLADLTGALAASHFNRYPPALKDGIFTVYEPAVGAGGLLLGQFRQWNSQGVLVPFSKIKVVANDLDPLCSAMTALQLLANAIYHLQDFATIRITVGNTLLTELEVGMDYVCVPIETFMMRALGEVA